MVGTLLALARMPLHSERYRTDGAGSEPYRVPSGTGRVAAGIGSEIIFPGQPLRSHPPSHAKESHMGNIVYIVGAIVIVVALLSFFGLR